MALPIDKINQNEARGVVVLERKQESWSDDSPTMDTKLIKKFLEENPNVRINAVMHSGVKHLLIVYGRI